MTKELDIDNYAVLEHRIDTSPEQWEIIVHIGEMWFGGCIDEYYEGSPTYKACDLRIRYLDRGVDR